MSAKTNRHRSTTGRVVLLTAFVAMAHFGMWRLIRDKSESVAAKISAPIVVVALPMLPISEAIGPAITPEATLTPESPLHGSRPAEPIAQLSSPASNGQDSAVADRQVASRPAALPRRASSLDQPRGQRTQTKALQSPRPTPTKPQAPEVPITANALESLPKAPATPVVAVLSAATAGGGEGIDPVADDSLSPVAALLAARNKPDEGGRGANAGPHARPATSTAGATASSEAATPVTLRPSVDAAVLSVPARSYPDLSRRLDEQGTVSLTLTVNATGQAQAIQIVRSSGYPRLDVAARRHIARTQFRPGSINAVPTAMPYEVTVRFALGDVDERRP